VTSEPAAETVDAVVADAQTPADQTPAPVAEPQFIEVWRPGGRSDERRGPRRHARPQRPRGEPPAQGAEQTAGAPEQAAGADGAPAASPAEPSRRGRRRGRSDRPDHERQARPAQPERQGRPERNDRPRPPRFDRSDRKDQRSDRRPNRGGEPRVFASSEQAPRERRTREPDPNSPFAKLAALKAQLEANEKEKR
jgi:ATP-dependent RNA helicase SUPV3L1/SUV3